MSGPREMAAPGVHERAFALLAGQVRPPARCVDLAAGQGAFSRRLHRAGFEVVAVDADPGAYRVPEVPLRVADLERPFAAGLGPGGFDVCVALEILEHVRAPYAFLGECRALLRPGGVLLVSSPNVESVASRMLFVWNGRLRHFSAKEVHHVSPIFSWYLERGLREAGFAPLQTAYNRHEWECGESWKARAASLLARVAAPILRGEKRGEIRLVLARGL